MNRPEVGQEVNGFAYEGGDPNNPLSWKKLVNVAPEQKAPDFMDKMSGTEKFMAGVGSGMVDAGRRTTNFVLPKALEPEWATKEAIEEQSKLDEKLLSSGAGLAGNITGGIAATLPAGGLLGAGAKGAAGMARGGSVLQRALQAGHRVGTGTSIPAMMGQNALWGAALADEGEKVGGAATGAIVSGVLGGAGRVLKNAVTGVVKPSAKAATLIDEGMSPTLGQAADEEGISGLAKMVHNDILPNVPFVGGAINKQNTHAFNEARNRVAMQALPDYAEDLLEGTAAQLDDQGTMRVVNSFWDHAYDGVKGFEYNVNDKWLDAAGDISAAAKRKLTAALKANNSSGSAASGEALLSSKATLQEFINSSKGQVKANYVSARQHIDKIIENQLGASGPKTKAAQVLREYNALKDPYRKYQDILKAQSGAAREEGAYKFQDLAAASAGRTSPAKAAAGEGALQQVANDFMDVYADPPQKRNLWRFLATMGVLAPAIGGTVSGNDAAQTTGWLATAGLLASAHPSAQKALLGQFGGQQALLKALQQGKITKPMVEAANRAAGVGTTREFTRNE